MKNIALTLDAALLRKAEILAAEKGISIGDLFTSCLENVVCERKSFNCARQRALRRLREGMDLHWSPARQRDTIHER